MISPCDFENSVQHNVENTIRELAVDVPIKHRETAKPLSTITAPAGPYSNKSEQSIEHSVDESDADVAGTTPWTFLLVQHHCCPLSIGLGLRRSRRLERVGGRDH